MTAETSATARGAESSMRTKALSRQLKTQRVPRASEKKQARADDFFWPPTLGQRYPDFALLDQEGHHVTLSDFKGKIILLEPVGMTCSACQAFLGANRSSPGPLGNITPQAGLDSIKTYLAQYGGIHWPHPRVVHVQLLLYNLEMNTPTAEDARVWAEHFGQTRARNEIVLAADERFQGQASFDMIPGF